jgi:hypothetical protein
VPVVLGYTPSAREAGQRSTRMLDSFTPAIIPMGYTDEPDGLSELR